MRFDHKAMAENPSDDKKGATFDPAIQSEKLGFDASEMAVCPVCGRDNPPTRAACIYCAAELPVRPGREAGVRLNLRPLEPWEHGFNLISTADAGHAANALVRELSMDPEDAGLLAGAGVPLPLARVESETVAAVLAERLEGHGLDCTIIADAELAPDEAPTRLRGIEFCDDELRFTDFNTGAVVAVAPTEVTVIVTGVLATSRIDSLEKRRRRGNVKVIDETATSSDEPVLDIYTRLHPLGFRVYTAGFDFSGLGGKKGLLAGENLARLTSMLSVTCAYARLVTDYGRVRAGLGPVWEVDERRDGKGLQRSGFGRREFGAVATTSNLRQFTRYSRLQRHLYEAEEA